MSKAFSKAGYFWYDLMCTSVLCTEFVWRLWAFASFSMTPSSGDQQARLLVAAPIQFFLSITAREPLLAQDLGLDGHSRLLHLSPLEVLLAVSNRLGILLVHSLEKF
jgi:hypothetical protein